MNTNMTGFHKYFRPCALNESSLSNLEGVNEKSNCDPLLI